MKRNKIALAIVSMASTALLAKFQGSAPASNGSAQLVTKLGKTIKIGYNLELSGAVAAYGQAEKNGADLAVEEINAMAVSMVKKLKLYQKTTNPTMQKYHC